MLLLDIFFSGHAAWLDSLLTLRQQIPRNEKDTATCLAYTTSAPVPRRCGVEIPAHRGGQEGLCQESELREHLEGEALAGVARGLGVRSVEELVGRPFSQLAPALPVNARLRGEPDD